MAFATMFLASLLWASAGAAQVRKPGLDRASHSQEVIAAMPMHEAHPATGDRRNSDDHLPSFLTARIKRSHAHDIDDPETAHASEKPWFKEQLSGLDRRSAVAISSISGTVIGAVVGWTGLWQSPGACRSAAFGGFIGAAFGFLMELPSNEKTDATKELPEGNTTELPEPALEKIHQLALTAVALSDYEEGRAKLKGNETEKLIEHAAEKKAVRALDDIAERMNSSKKEPMVESEGDFEAVQEVLSEGDTAEFVTAEAAVANNALLTANDIARVQAGKNGSQLRGEDLGPMGDLKSFQGDMVPGNDKQLLLFQTMAVKSDGSTHGPTKDSVSAGAT